MQEVTRILAAIEHGVTHASEHLLPLVYEQLKRLAAEKLAQERPGQTIQATALVHEAYIRLVDVDLTRHWDCRGHFFAAAAEAMRRILIENARRKTRQKRGGECRRVELDAIELSVTDPHQEILAIDDALNKLGTEDPQAAQLVKLRLFAGLSVADAAEMLGLSRSTAYEHWAYARAWLRCQMDSADSNTPQSESI